MPRQSRSCDVEDTFVHTFAVSGPRNHSAGKTASDTELSAEAAAVCCACSHQALHVVGACSWLAYVCGHSMQFSIQT